MGGGNLKKISQFETNSKNKNNHTFPTEQIQAELCAITECTMVLFCINLKISDNSRAYILLFA